MMKATRVRFDPEMLDRLNKLAADNGVSMADIVRACVTAGIDRVRFKAVEILDPKVPPPAAVAPPRGPTDFS